MLQVNDQGIQMHASNECVVCSLLAVSIRFFGRDLSDSLENIDSYLKLAAVIGGGSVYKLRSARADIAAAVAHWGVGIPFTCMSPFLSNVSIMVVSAGWPLLRGSIYILLLPRLLEIAHMCHLTPRSATVSITFTGTAREVSI